MRRTWCVLLGLVLVAAASASAQTAKFPDKPIKIVVGFAAGGGTDVVARILALKMSESLGQTVVVENRPGASGMIAGEIVAKSAADGYTLMMGSQTTLAVAPTLYKKDSLDPARDFAGVAMGAISPLVLVVPFGGCNPQNVIATRPAGTVYFGSGGLGRPHMTGERLVVRRHRWRTFPRAPANNDLIGGNPADVCEPVRGHRQCPRGAAARWPSPARNARPRPKPPPWRAGLPL